VTVKLGLTDLSNSQGQWLNANATFAQLDQLVQASAVDKDLSAPPSTPSNGSLYIIASGAPTGDWAGHGGELAYWLDSTNAWQFIEQNEGFLVRVIDEHEFYYYDGSAWVIWSGGGGGSNAWGDLTGVPSPIQDLAALVDPSADRILFWDDSAGIYTHLTIGSGLSITGTTISGTPQPAAPSVVVPDTTTSRTVSISDIGAYLRFTNASPVTLTVPTQASESWTADAEITIRRVGAGALTIAPAPGVTLNAPAGGTLNMTSGMTVTIKRAAADSWDVIGQTVPA